MKNSFVLYTEYKEHIDQLSLEEKGMLLDAIFCHAVGENIELTGAVKMAFSFIKTRMDKDAEKYEKTCEARREAGSKGGQAKANNAKQKLANASTANQMLANANFDKQMLANDSNTKQELASDSKAKQDVANLADNDNEYDNDNDINLKEKYKKKKFGTYENVKLTEEEYQRLMDDYGHGLVLHAIEYLSAYMKEKGYKSKDHNLTIRRWVIKAVTEQENQQPNKSNKFINFAQSYTPEQMQELEQQLLEN